MENPNLITEIGNKNRKLIEDVYSWEVEKLKASRTFTINY